MNKDILTLAFEAKIKAFIASASILVITSDCSLTPGVEEEEVVARVDESDTGASPQAERKPLDPPKYEVRPGLGEK